MWTEQQREYMRDVLIESLNDSVSIRSAGLDIGAAMANANKSKPQNVFATATRPKGESKINCSMNVFEHNRVKKCIQQCSELERLWICYQYSDRGSDSNLRALVKLTVVDIEESSNRKDVKANNEKLVETLLRTRREVSTFMHSKIYDEMGVSKKVYFQRYRVKTDDFKKQMESLDNAALDRLLSLTRITQKVRY